MKSTGMYVKVIIVLSESVLQAPDKRTTYLPSFTTFTYVIGKEATNVSVGTNRVL